MDTKNTIVVAFVNEEETVKSLSITLISLLENANKLTNYEIKIIRKKEYLKENIEMILSFVDKYKNCKIEFINQNYEINIEQICDIGKVVSKALPISHKCIYLSSNVVVQDDLSDLYNINVSNTHICAVKSSSIEKFDSNVLLVNMKKFRDDNSKKIDITPLELKNNLNASYFKQEKSFNFKNKINMSQELVKLFDKKQIRDAIMNNVIFSYTNEINPFNAFDVSFSNVWFEYYKKLPITNIEDFNMPKISAIVPIYNVENYLERCILSITNQSYYKLQIILVNDGSADSCGEICDKLELLDNRITVIHKENGGLSSARNSGMEIADGEYISFIDSDDFINPDTYLIAMSIFNENKNIDLVEWEYQNLSDNIDAYDDFSFEKFNSYVYEIHNKEEYLLSNINYSKHYHIVWNKLYKKDLVKNIRFELGKCNEDVFFSNEYMFKVGEVAYVPDKLHYYLQRSTSIINDEKSITNTDGIEGLYLRHKIIVKSYPRLIEQDLKYTLAYAFRKINRIVKNNLDKDKKTRVSIMNIMLNYYEYIIKFDNIPQNIKDDFNLAKKDVLEFIEKHEKNSNVKKAFEPNKISVIVPVYNVEEYIKRCILSIINQTYNKFEIILVNDGSTDNSANICEQLANEYSNITVIHKENGGLSSARNVGMEIATGEYISFIDSDDLIHPQTYALAINTFNSNFELDFVEWEYQSFSSKVPEYNSLEFIRVNGMNLDVEIHDKNSFMYNLIGYRKHKHVVWNKLFKNEFINEIRFLNGKFAEDVYFTNCFIKKVNRIAYIPLKLYFYYIRTGSIMNSNITMKFIDDIDAFYERHLIVKSNFYDNPGYLNLSLETNLNLINDRLYAIIKENNDKDKKMSISTVVKMVKYYYDDVINSEHFNKNIKRDFILAKQDYKTYIYNLDFNKEKIKINLSTNVSNNKISVIVPVYNVQNYLKLCVLSILNQTYKNLEIILVNDGSTDDSGRICDELSKEYSNIEVIHQKNGGLSSARNTGMKIATSDYISFIDSDDYIHPQTYSIAMSIFRNNTSLNFVEWQYVSFYEWIAEYDNIEFNKFNEIEIELSDKINFIIELNKPNKHGQVVWNKLYKKDFISDLSFIDGIFAEDLFFTNNFMNKIDKVAFIPLNLHFYYQRTNSIMRSNLTIKSIVDIDGYYGRHDYIKENYPQLTDLSLNYVLDRVYEKLDKISQQNNDYDKIIRKSYITKVLHYFYDDILNSNQIGQIIKDDFTLAKKDINDFIDLHEFGIKCDCDDCLKGSYNPNEYIVTEKDIIKLDIERPLGLTGHLRVKDEALTIGECIESCIDFLDELIITYNDSTDGTEEIIEFYRKKYKSKIKVYHYKPFVAVAREYTKYIDIRSVHNLANYYNFGYVKTSYKYYMKIDGDQIYFTSKLLKIKEKLLFSETTNEYDEVSEYIEKYSSSPELFGFRFGGINLTENIKKLEVNMLEKPLNGCVGDHMIWIPTSKKRYTYDEEKMWETFEQPQESFNCGFAWLHFGYAKRLMQGVGIQLCQNGYPLENFANLSWSELSKNFNFIDVIKNPQNMYFHHIYLTFCENWWDKDRVFISEVVKRINLNRMEKILKKYTKINSKKTLNSHLDAFSESDVTIVKEECRIVTKKNEDELKVIIVGNESNAREITSKIKFNEISNHKIKIVAICTFNNWLHDNYYYISLRGDGVREIPFISYKDLVEITNENNNYIVILGEKNYKKLIYIYNNLSKIGIKKVVPNFILDSLMQNSLNSIQTFNTKDKALILCSPMKTGNITIETTLPKNNINFITLVHKPFEFKWFNNYNKIKLITAVREPIIQTLSVIYQEIAAPYENPFNVLLFELFDNKEHFLSNLNNIYPFLDKYIDERMNLQSSYYIDSFLNSFRENILDLSQYPFDKEKGYSIIKEGNIEVFVYQLEKMNDIVTEMSDWIGETKFDTWVRANEASGKWVAEHYKQVQKEIKISQKFFDECYNDPWIKHFYSEEDIEKFKERWRPHIKGFDSLSTD